MRRFAPFVLLVEELALGAAFREEPAALPEVGEPEVVRHYVRLSQQNFAIDLGMYPLGSCTMKLNATTEMLPVTWPEVCDMHPFAPADQCGGFEAMIKERDQLKDRRGSF